MGKVARKKERAANRNQQRAMENYHARAWNAAHEARSTLFEMLAKFEPGQYDNGYQRESEYAKTISCEVDGVKFVYLDILYRRGTTKLQGYKYIDPISDVVVNVNSPKWVDWYNSLSETTIAPVYSGGVFD